MAIVRAARAIGDEELAVYVLVAANLGARRGEMVALRWADVDLDEGRIIIQRGATRGDGGLAAVAGILGVSPFVDGPR